MRVSVRGTPREMREIGDRILGEEIENRRTKADYGRWREKWICRWLYVPSITIKNKMISNITLFSMRCKAARV